MAKEHGQRICFELGRTPGLGNVALFDGLEYRLAWRADGLLPFGAIIRSQTFVYTGDWALRLRFRGPLPNGVLWKKVYRYIYIPTETAVEVVARMSTPVLSPAGGYGFELEVHRGAVVWRYALRMARIGGAVQLLNGATGSWIGLESSYHLAKGSWHEFGFQADLGTHDYLKAWIDGHEYDLSGRFGLEEESAFADHARLVTWWGGYGSSNQIVYADDFMVRKLIERS